ncbi:hypothetical protein [Catenovulum agarivorans]|uniref:bestrophin-like domain n=1 Tax=Catenovulum agarivorans TaxID=1172192 RepID=UPI0002E1E56D|nr:hypothetical protein [Catenovulum agarivorans]
MLGEHFLYSLSSISIVLVLFSLLVVFNQCGYWLGQKYKNDDDGDIKALTNAVQTSTLGLLALLLGFTFSMSMQRYDQRNQAMIAETNEVQNLVLQVQLLPEQHQQQLLPMIHKYVEQRLELGQIDITRFDERAAYQAKVKVIQQAMWLSVAQIAQQNNLDMSVITKQLQLVFETYNKRNALLMMHVPEVVIYLLFTVFVSAFCILGYSSGLASKRIIIPTTMVMFLITMIVFIIIDLDRPKRGLIKVNQDSMQLIATELQQIKH